MPYRPPSFARRLALLLVGGLFLLLTATGCTTVPYLLQAGCGQLDLGARARPIADVVEDPHTPPRIREYLARIPSIKRFGERHGLTPTKSYGTYADLERQAAVWVVTASEPLRFHPKTWAFPIVGSVPYLGWFNRDDAVEFAARLRDDGWDVDVRPAGAYSTLGWFRDPILSTMIPEGEEAFGELVNVVLHESLHATLYIKGQTQFNESVANFVGDKLTPIYLDEALGPNAAEKQAYLSSEEEHKARTKRLHEIYVHLDTIYKSRRSSAEKLLEKRTILSELRRELGFKRPLNNATLIGFKNYNSGGKELDTLLASCGNSFPRFIAALRGLDPKTFAGTRPKELAEVVLPLARAGCPERL